MRLIYFSPIYAGSYAQRPHFMVRALLEHGVESALWVNPYPCRLLQWQDVLRASGLNDQGTPLDPRVRLLNLRALPIEPLPLGSRLNRLLLWRRAWREIERYAADGPVLLGIGRPCALALAALDQLRPAASFYDAMDNFPEFHRGLSRWAVRRHENAVAAKVDLVVASSTFLTEKFARRGLRVERLSNACESTSATTDRGPSLIGSEPAVAGPKPESFNPPSVPVLGYLGCIAHWFDWQLLIRLAERLPQMRIELVGPCTTAPPAVLPANVRLLPACQQSQVASHLARFSAGLIPFRQSALTAGVDPIKYYEYRAAGLPVLSTSFGEMARRGQSNGVYFLDRSDDLAAAVTAALRHRYDATAIDHFQHDNNWTSRFEQSVGFRSLWPASRMHRAA